MPDELHKWRDIISGKVDFKNLDIKHARFCNENLGIWMPLWVYAPLKKAVK